MVVKCPKCNQYVSDTASVCPKCGASMTVITPKNLANDVTDTNNHSESPQTFNSNIEVFPELAPNLRQHLITHNEVGNSSDVITYINFNGNVDDELCIYNHRGNWLDGEPIRLEGEDSGFCLRLDFLASSDDKREYVQNCIKIDNERFQRFRNLNCFSSFAPHRSCYEIDNGWLDEREFAIDLSKDIEKASVLISEILQKVYLVPLSQELVISIDDGSRDQENIIEENASSTQVVNDSTTENIDEQNGSYEAEDDSAGVWMNILCFLIPIVGLVLYFVKKNDYPNTAKSYLTWAAAGFGVSILINIIL